MRRSICDASTSRCVAQVPTPWLSIHQVYSSLRGLGVGCQRQAVGAREWEGVERCGRAPKAQTRPAPAAPGWPRQRWATRRPVSAAQAAAERSGARRRVLWVWSCMRRLTRLPCVQTRQCQLKLVKHWGDKALSSRYEVKPWCSKIHRFTAKDNLKMLLDLSLLYRLIMCRHNQ